MIDDADAALPAPAPPGDVHDALDRLGLPADRLLGWARRDGVLTLTISPPSTRRTP